jgi:hypothetical protein
MNPTQTGPGDQCVPWKSLFKEKELWLLVLSGILFFYQPLFTQQTFFFRDLFAHFLPQKRLLAQVLKGGELPLWDPYLSGGQPFLGDVQNLVLYPTSLLYLVLPLLTAFNIELVFHVIFSSVAAYLLARTLRLSPISACVVGIVYGYCGYTLSLTNVMNRLLAMPYLPLALLFWHQFLNRHRWRWFSFTVLAGVFQIFAGAPEMALVTFGFLLMWSLIHQEAASLYHRLALWLLLMIFIAGVSSVQILPGLEMTRQSSRAEPGSYKVFAAWSMNPKRLPETFVSNFFGYAYGLTQRDYWGSRMEDRQFPYILSIYFGAVTLLLAGVAPFLKGTSPLSFRLRLLLLLILVISIVLSCGRFVPFFDYFYKSAILINRFRYPIKFLACAVLPVALLTGVSVEMLFGQNLKPRAPLILLWIFSGGLVLLYGLFLLFTPFYEGFLNSYFGMSAPTVQKGVLEALLHTATIALAATFLLQLHFLKPGLWQQRAFAVLLVLDLFYAGYFVNSYAPSEFFIAKPPLANMVLNNIEGGRFFRDQDPKTIVLKMPANDIIYSYRWEQETLYNYVGAYYSIPVIYHQDYDGLGKKEIQQLTRFLYSSPWERRGPILTASGITIILAPRELDLPGVVALAKIRTTSNTPFYLFRDVNSTRARFVNREKRATNSEEAYKMVTDPGFDPTTEVILEGEPAVRTAVTCGAASVKETSTHTNSSSYHASIPCDGFLVFSEPYYAGWEVTIDGQSAKLLEANFAFSAVRITPGNHTIERVYRPRSFRNGLILSFLFTTLLVIIPLFAGRSRKGRQK